MAALRSNDFERIFSITLIAEIISSHLTLAGMVALGRANRLLRAAIEDQWDLRFNINSFLKGFIRDVSCFRRRLGETDALIVGSAPLNFLESGHRRLEQLDLLVEQGDHENRLVEYLCHNEGYVVAEVNQQLQNLSGEIRQLTHSLILKTALLTKEIRLKAVNTFPIHALLQPASVTAELNFMSWNKLYSIFPWETSSKHKSYPLRCLDDRFGSLLAELALQGWTTRDLVWLGFDDPAPKGIGRRRAGDRYSAAVTIVPELAFSAPTPDYVIEHAEFTVVDQNLRPSTDRKGRIFSGSRDLIMRVEPLISPALFYRYTTSAGYLTHSWRDYAIERLKRWATIELYKLPPAMRPIGIRPEEAHSNIELSSRILLPETWDYADDQIPVWYESHVKASGE